MVKRIEKGSSMMIVAASYLKRLQQGEGSDYDIY